MLMKINM